MTQQIRDLIAQRAPELGIDPQHAMTMASIESSFDPNAGRGSANPHKGLFQFGPDEWKQYGGGGDIYDPNAQLDAFAKYHGDIQNQLTKSLGRAPTPQELYLGWQQGAGGAANLLQNRDKPAADVIGNAAWANNGGAGPQTAGGFADQWANNYNQHLASLGGSPVTVAAQPQGGLLQPQGIDAEIAQWSNSASPSDYAALASVQAKDKENQKSLSEASDMAIKLGSGLLGNAVSRPMDWPTAQAQVHRPQATPDFSQMLAQQRLLRRT